MMNRRYAAYILVPVIMLSVMYYAFALDMPKRFMFDEQNALEEWQEKVFNGRVLYQVQEEREENFLLAQSEDTSSGLIYKMKFDVNEFPMISWQWKVKTFPDKLADGDSSDGWVEQDDYAARVYVIFASWNFMSIKSLEYIWDERLPEETVSTSPYIENIKLIVAESGPEQLEQWVREERNIYEDYVKAFGKKPPRYVAAIALMTDADNSSSSAEAMYKNLKVGYADE